MFATPEEAEHAFYEALDQADVVRLMQVWADDEEVVCIHPGGLRIVGHSAVHDSWQQVLANGPLHVRPLRPLVMLSMMCAVHVLVEQVAVQTREGTQFANCYATNIYHKGPTMPRRRPRKPGCSTCTTYPTCCTESGGFLVGRCSS
jgi:hypothetical protein